MYHSIYIKLKFTFTFTLKSTIFTLLYLNHLIWSDFALILSVKHYAYMSCYEHFIVWKHN